MSNTNKIKISDKLVEIFNKIEDKVSWGIVELEYPEDPKNYKVHNGMGLEEIDVSDEPHHFNVVIKGKPTKIKIAQLLRYLWKNRFSNKEIHDFDQSYEKLVRKKDKTTPRAPITPNYGHSGHNRSYYGYEGGYQSTYVRPKKKGEKVSVVNNFTFKPNDPEHTFLSLTSETYPKGHEDEVIKYLPMGLTKDRFGNYYKIVGKGPHTTMFTCHLDTASHTKTKISQMKGNEKDSDIDTDKKGDSGDMYIYSDGESILGADDKAGCTVLVYLINNKVPGVYYFFMGEERGGVGSYAVSGTIEEFTFLDNIKKVVSFDRKNYHSVITAQRGNKCCSDEFANALCTELGKGGLTMRPDSTGVFTDSASFDDKIPECTNVSVGYFSEHTHNEILNITYLTKLCKACVLVDWEKLPIVRKIGISKETTRKYGDLIKEIKKARFTNDCTVESLDDGSYIILTMDDDVSLYSVNNDISKLEELTKTYKDLYVDFGDDVIKIKLV